MRSTLAFACVLLSGWVSAQDLPRRIREPQPPFPYNVVDVTYPAADGTTIGGTLTAPRTGARHPAVLLLPGSGPNDRDATLAGHKLFLVLADHLTRHGIVVLRTDSRGVGKTAGNYFEATGDTLAADALAGVAFLRQRAEVDGRRVGLLGHSLGTVVAALAATRSSDVAWLVLLSPPARPDIDNATERLTARLRQKNAPQAEVDRMTALLRRATSDPDWEGTREAVRELTVLIAGDMIPPDQVNGAVEGQLTSMRSPWGRYFTAFDPRSTVAKIACPVLAVFGSLDQALPPANLLSLQNTLRAAGNRDATVVELFGLNHLLQTAPTGAMSEIAGLEESMSPRVLSLVASWIEQSAAVAPVSPSPNR